MRMQNPGEEIFLGHVAAGDSKELLKKLVIITMLLALAASIASCGKTDDKEVADRKTSCRERV